MIAYMDCPSARERLEAFLDGELEVSEQVALEWHLQWCRTCAARVEDMQTIGDALRTTAAARVRDENPLGMAFVRDCVFARVRAEREAAWHTRLAVALRERRLLWPAVGATAAVVICLVAMGAVLRMTTLQTPDSLAGMIGVLASPGSDLNPVRLDARISVPRGLDHDPIFASLPDEEIEMALAAVVTRDGRVATYELLEATRSRVRRHQGAALTDDMDAVLDAVGRARFSPAQLNGSDPVAVNLVWLVTSTTVRSSVSAGLSPGIVVPQTSMLPAPVTVAPVPDQPAVLPIDLEMEIEPETGSLAVPATTA